jgi:tRNA A-37 threonylcarbamoyl transferase component Bud32
MILLSATPGAPADRAGLRRGDVLLSVDGIRTRNYFSWVAARAQVELNKPQPVEGERDGRPFRTQLVSINRERRGIVPNSVFPVVVALKALGFGLVFLIIWQRPRDPAALLAAWLMASAMSAAAIIGTGMAAVFRQLPAVLALLMLFPFFCNVAGIAVILFTFCAAFPRRLFRSTWPYVVAWVPLSAMFVISFPHWYRMVYRPEALRDGIPNWSLPTAIPSFMVFAVGALVVLFVNYRRLPDINERRRVRVLVTGLAVSWIVVVPVLFALNMGANHPLARPFLNPVLGPLLIVVSFTFPCALTYAVLRHRVFDVRVMMRQGLQYAVARRALLAVVPVLAILLLTDLFAHGQKPVAEVLRSRGLVYGALAALALLAHSKRQAWLDALDRRFFRDRYDAQRLLRGIVEDLRTASSFEHAATQVAAKVESALHAEFAAVYLKHPGESLFTAIAASPTGSAPPPLLADAKFIGMIRLLESPLLISGASDWGQHLPANESALLRELRLDLLLPISVTAAQREALLALGPKRSEEPYAREDFEMLASIASSLALLLQRPPVAADVEEAFLECPECGWCYELGATTCSRHPASLITVHAPRIMNGRYRLERCIGRGGMGAVYAALDTALERRVAVKLIREDLVGSASAADRFRREAKAAAAFTHPNVVTVHDFGLTTARAFLIMELLEGRSLRQELQRVRRIPPERLLTILQGVSSALQAAHRRNLIHRDLKPENVFLARMETGEIPKVLDFGLAKTISEETQITTDTSSGTLVGTLPYMSPEQLQGEAAGPAFDLWALSVVAYECLTGALPFSAKTPAEWTRAVTQGRLTPIGEHLPEAPDAWHQFFAAALSLDQQSRPPTAREWYEGFAHSLAAVPPISVAT